jgi:hypothetical protein
VRERNANRLKEHGGVEKGADQCGFSTLTYEEVWGVRRGNLRWEGYGCW